eukprot:TRINITY_DN135086_c1_g1_i1.p1 TRINITY_DN135086_c1_g1~~TRINITY_DN135086_c1_g1_i1.p1  ORF type:complete len:770 (-),score=136.49 TRINITY_DN135086_c1_g1_i1:282-2591(-)
MLLLCVYSVNHLKFKKMMTSYSKKLISPQGRLEPIETDPYSPVIVQELLQGSTEWSQIQDIVKLTFKAMLDVMKAHSEAIRELERTVPTKASKAEVNSGLSQKASISDVSKTVAEVAANIESRATVEEVQQLLESKISKSDFQYALSNKVSIDEMRAALEGKVGARDVEGDLKLMKAKIEQTQSELQHRLTSMPTLKDLEEMKKALGDKATVKEVAEGLNSKANKDSVAAALNRKANRDEINAALSKKVELTDIQKVVASLEAKVDSEEFETVSKVLEEQFERIKEIERAIEERGSPKEIQDLVNEKTQLSKMENEKKWIDIEREVNTLRKNMNEEVERLVEAVSAKADAMDMERIKEVIEYKPDMQAVSDHINDLKKAVTSEIDAIKFQLDKKMNEVVKADLNNIAARTETTQNELKRLKETLMNLADERRKDSEETQKALKSLTTSTKLEKQEEQRDFQRELAAVRKEIDTLGQKKCERKELQDLKNLVKKELEAKVYLEEVQRAISDVKSETARRFIELTEETKREIRDLEESLYGQLKRKANSAELASALEQKVERSMIMPLLDQKASVSDVEIVKSRIGNLQAEVNKKASNRELDTHALYTKENIEEIKRELSLRANIKDVCALVDIKANVEDVNKGFEDLEKEVVVKADTEELKSALSSQAMINEALCAENCAGRWIWKSGLIKSGYAIPWELQSVNTCPDNFLWEKDKISVLTVAPGLYEVSLGFFASKKPAVQLLVNGEPVLSPVNSSRQTLRGKLTKIVT